MRRLVYTLTLIVLSAVPILSLEIGKADINMSIVSLLFKQQRAITAC